MKVRRAIWQWLLRPLYTLLPGRGNRVRIWVLRMMGADIARHCFIGRNVDVLMPWNLVMGERSSIGHDCEIVNFARVSIGPMSVVSQHTSLCTGSHDHTHPHFPLTFDPIVIGSECWVAAWVFVGPGVTIGDGAVIGVRSVALKDMPEWQVCGGHPCRPIKPREIKRIESA